MTKTQNEYFNEILNSYDLSAEHREFIENRIKALAKKKESAKTKLTDTQKENLEYMAQIVEMLKGANVEYTTKMIGDKLGLSPQKVTPMLIKLVNENKVHCNIVKKVKLYSSANA